MIWLLKVLPACPGVSGKIQPDFLIDQTRVFAFDPSGNRRQLHRQKIFIFTYGILEPNGSVLISDNVNIYTLS